MKRKKTRLLKIESSGFESFVLWSGCLPRHSQTHNHQFHHLLLHLRWVGGLEVEEAVEMGSQ
jgi:hypothetical protein